MSTRLPKSQISTGVTPSILRDWPIRRKQVAVRISLLGCSYLVFVLTLDLLLWRHGVTTTYSNGSSSGTYNGSITHSLYQVNPGPIITIIVVEILGLIVSTLSLWRRIVRGSSKIGVPAVVVASVLGVVGVAGMLSVGPYILVLSALMLMTALPIDAGPAR